MVSRAPGPLIKSLERRLAIDARVADAGVHHIAKGRLPMLKLYYSPGTSSLATHIALNEADADFEAVPTPMAENAHKAPAYMAINPEGKVPTLTVDGRPLTEVAATLYYIARAYPDAKLMPTDDAEAEAQVISWMSFAASALHPTRLLEPADAQVVWAVAEQKFGDGDWAVGDSFTVADIHLFRLFWRFNGMLGLDEAKFPRLHALKARMLARPAVQKTFKAEGVEP